MYFSNFDSVVGQEVVPDELETLRLDEEAKHFSVIIEELFLGIDFSSSKLLLEVFEELRILLRCDWLLRLDEGIFRAS